MLVVHTEAHGYAKLKRTLVSLHRRDFSAGSLPPPPVLRVCVSLSLSLALLLTVHSLILPSVFCLLPSVPAAAMPVVLFSYARAT